MDTLGDLLVRGDRPEDPNDDLDVSPDNIAVRVSGDPAVEYARPDFVTTAWKTASFFRHRGVHEGTTVAVVDDAAAPSLLSFFGAVQLGAVVRFVPLDADSLTELDARLLVGPGERVLDFDLPPGGKRIAYTDDPEGVDDPTVEAFGKSIWSENPVAPPEKIAPDAPALTAVEGTHTREGPRTEVHTHEEMLATAARVAATTDMEGEVAVRAPLSDPRTVAAGVVAPLLVGGTVVFPRRVDDSGSDAKPAATIAVTHGPAPEPETVELSEVRIHSA